MRILAIRGKNLASLANDFEVLLEEGVLQQVGLFAITGPTGAGKSTILDALCLALYDQMPRLPEGHGVAIGHRDEDETLRVKSHDVSSILRRGTANAYAEVDFIGQDKQAYRARWEISRARGKVNGRLQAQKINLQLLHSGEIIGQGKKDTQLEIIKRLGLNFDQFRRSVLLAQGDFAAFLKAKKDERSSLLEKITGTDIYSELSVAAFERAKQERALLDSIVEKLADKNPLAADTRAELEQEKLHIAKQLIALQQDLQKQQQISVWFRSQALLQKEQQQAQGKVELAQNKWDNHVADRALLLQVEQAQPLRSLLQQEQTMQQEWQEAESTLIASQKSLVKVEHTLSEISTREVKLNQAYSIAKQCHNDAQPLLIVARKLDTQIEGSQSRLSLLTIDTSTQQEKWQTACATYEKSIQQKNQQENSLQQLALWQELHLSIQPLADEWGRWEAEIKKYLTLDRELQQDRKTNAELQTNISLQQGQIEELQTNNKQTIEEKNKLASQLEALETQVLALPLAELHQQKSRLENNQDSINSTLELAEKCLAERALILQDQAAYTSSESSIQAAQVKIKQLQEQQAINQIQLQEAQQALSLMQAASEKSAADFRALLKDQQPCPVCGSEQHPWAKLSQAIKQPVSAQQNRFNTLQTKKEQLIKDLSEELSLIKQSEKTKLDLSARITNTQSMHNSLRQQWLLITLDNKPDWTDIQPAYVTQLSTQIKALKSAYVKVKKQEAEALKQHAKLNDLRSTTEQFKQKYAKQVAAIAELDKKIAELSGIYLAKKETLQQRETEQHELLAVLNTPFEKIEFWRDKLTREGESFAQQIAIEVKEWQGKSAQKTAIQQQLQASEKKILATESEKKHQQKLYKQYENELAQQLKQHKDLESERKQYFDGVMVDEYKATIDKQLEQAELSQQRSKEELVAANTEIKTWRSTIQHWQKEKQRRADKKNIAVKELQAALQALQMNKETLQQLLSKENSWIVAQKETNQRLSTALQESRIALTVKTQSLQAHESDMPKETEKYVCEQINQLTEQQDKLTQDKENNSFLLRLDDEKTNSGKALQQQLQAQQSCWEKWESLNELIGSSTGHKFRIFAQGLTLETLLSYTNRHLQEFARRYYLQRVPGSDLELQVIDRDMADEVRSVHSLSGGESFLVSLALALGLASLSSNKTQVESLFIDEGFGSLDQETLDIAIASLDTLQSLGRKVGVISHVAVLVERIGAQILVEKQGGGQSTVSIKANS